MKIELAISKEFLASIDFMNTINGGMAFTAMSAWQHPEGYELNVKTAGFETDKMKVRIKNNRFTVFYPFRVLEGEMEMPYYLVNLPLDPNVDVNEISATILPDNILSIKAPFKPYEDNTNDREIFPEK